MHCISVLFQKILQLTIWKKIDTIDINDLLDSHKYLMKEKLYKIMLWLIKKMFIGLLSDIVSASNHTKRVQLSTQKCMIEPTLINYCIS